jgi:hypothetical protein
MTQNLAVRATTLLFTGAIAIFLVAHGCSSQPAPRPVGNEMASPSASASDSANAAEPPHYLPATKAGGVIMPRQAKP